MMILAISTQILLSSQYQQLAITNHQLLITHAEMISRNHLQWSRLQLQALKQCSLYEAKNEAYLNNTNAMVSPFNISVFCQQQVIGKTSLIVLHTQVSYANASDDQEIISKKRSEVLVIF